MACTVYIVHPSNYIGQVIADDDGMEVLPTNKTLQCQTGYEIVPQERRTITGFNHHCSVALLNHKYVKLLLT